MIEVDGDWIGLREEGAATDDPPAALSQGEALGLHVFTADDGRAFTLLLGRVDADGTVRVGDHGLDGSVEHSVQYRRAGGAGAIQGLRPEGWYLLEANDPHAFSILDGSTSARLGVSAGNDAGIFALVHRDADEGEGATIVVSGSISGSSLTIKGGRDRDEIDVDAASIATRIEAGEADDTIRLAARSAVLGTSRTIAAAVTVVGGGGRDTLWLDDSANTGRETATLTGTTVTGLGMAGGGVGYEEIERVDLALGSGGTEIEILGTRSGTVVSIRGGAGDDVFNVGNGTLDRLDGLLEIRGEGGEDRLAVDRSAGSGASSGRLTGDRLTGLGLGAGVDYGGVEAVSVLLGAGSSDFTVSGLSADTTVDTGAGADSLTFDLGLLGSGHRVTLWGGAEEDTVTFTTAAAADLTFAVEEDRDGIVFGVVTAAGMAGEVRFAGYESVVLRMGDGADRLTIAGTAAPIAVYAGGGADSIRIEGASHAVTLDSGAGGDTVTLLDLDAGVDIGGDGSSDDGDRLVVDLSATTAATEGGALTDGESVDVDFDGAISGLFGGTARFAGLDSIDILLGSGNDVFRMDYSFDDVVVTVRGGEGRDVFNVDSLGRGDDGADGETVIYGEGQEDTVRLRIPGAPQANGFSTLSPNVERLIVDNSDNDGAANDWILIDGATLRTAVTDAVLDTSPAERVEIIGSASGADTLTVESTTPRSVDGGIDVDRGRVTLTTQLDVLSSEQFARYRLYGGEAVTFSSLKAAASSYTENGVRFDFDHGMGVVDTPTAGLTGGGTDSTVTMQAVSGTAFALRSMTLRAIAPGPQQVTFAATTANGQTVTRSFTVIAEHGATVFDGGEFAALGAVTSVTWDTDGVVFDDILLRQAFGGVPATAEATTQIPIYTITSSITFNTSGMLARGSIDVDLDRDGQTDKTLSAGTGRWVFEALGIHAYFIDSGKVREFRFAGDLRFVGDITVNASGPLGLSLYASNDVFIGSDVKFDFSATDIEPGSGGYWGALSRVGGDGGRGGNLGQAGAGGLPGGVDGRESGGDGTDGGSGGYGGGGGPSWPGSAGRGPGGGDAGQGSTVLGSGGSGGSGSSSGGGGEYAEGGGTPAWENGESGSDGTLGGSGTDGGDGGNAGSGTGGRNTGTGSRITGGGEGHDAGIEEAGPEGGSGAYGGWGGHGGWGVWGGPGGGPAVTAAVAAARSR